MQERRRAVTFVGAPWPWLLPEPFLAGLSRGIALRLAHVQLPPADIPPLAGLVADVLVDADRLEAQGLVDPDARLVGECYACDQQAVAAPAQAVEQLGVELPADSAAVGAAVNVCADL